MSQADEFTADRNDSALSEPSHGDAPLVETEVTRPVRRMSARRVALQGPLFVLALAGIGFGGAMNWESRDQWRELVTGKPASLASGSGGGGCQSSMHGSCSARTSCSSEQAAVAGGCCQARSRAASLAGSCCSDLHDVIAAFVEQSTVDQAAATEASAETVATSEEDANPSDAVVSETAEASAAVNTAADAKQEVVVEPSQDNSAKE